MKRLAMKILVVIFIFTCFAFFHHIAFSENNSHMLYPMNQDELWGYVDEQGVWKIAPQWEEAGSFRGKGYAKVTVHDSSYSSGIIDSSGRYVLQPQYNIYDASMGQYYAGLENGIMWVDNGSDTLACFDTEIGHCSAFLFPVDQDPWISTDKIALVINHAAENKHRNAAYFDLKTEQFITPYQYHGGYSHNFENGYAYAAKWNDQTQEIEYFILSKGGKETSFPNEIAVLPNVKVSDDRILVFDKQKERYGYANIHDGEIIIPAKYHQATGFNNGYAAVTLDGKLWGHINPLGQWVVPPMFHCETGYEFFHGRAVLNMDGRHAVIDEQGHTIMQFSKGNTATILSNGGVFLVGESDISGMSPCALFSPAGNELISFEDGYLLDDASCYDGILFAEGLQALYSSMNEHFGYIDINGKCTVDFQFDYAENFFRSRAYVIVNGQPQYID